MPTTLSAVPSFSTPPATPIQGWSNSFVTISNDKQIPLYAQASYLTNVRNDGSVPVSLSKMQKGNMGNMKVSMSQNVYEADFEYGAQPLRWENISTGTGTIKHLPQTGAVSMQITRQGDVTIRQSRPYHRYQPGKSMFMATAVNFNGPVTSQVQRVGFFDDSNGIFFEQGDPVTALNGDGYFPGGNGMGVVVRADINGLPIDTRIEYSNWTDPHGIKGTLNWNNIQMLWMEYAWYGAGALRWGVLINGEAFILHEIGTGNTYTQAWSRTGNLPVRYEQRDIGTGSPNTMIHYGVSVIVEGGRDPQRGFTYAYGNSINAANNTGLRVLPSWSGVTGAYGYRFPLVSVRNRIMGTTVYTGVASSAVIANGGPITIPTTGLPSTSLSGLSIYFPTLTGLNAQYGTTARILSSSSTGVVCVDTVVGLISSTSTGYATLSGPYFGGYGVTPTTPISAACTFTNISAGAPYQIGLVNRGQILPQELLILSDTCSLCEFFVSTPNNPIYLSGGTVFTPMTAYGAYNSFAEINTTAVAFSGGECVYSFWINGGIGRQNANSNTVQDKDLSFFFPLYNTIKGNSTDILTLAITPYPNSGASNVGAHILAQEAMS